MRTATVARFAILISALWAGSHPAMAQPHRGGGGHPGGQMPHPGNGGMGQVPAHMQRQMQQQMQQQQRMYEQQMRQMQQQAHQQHQQNLQHFDRWLKANGGSGGAASRLPNNPAGFAQWAANQHQRKAQGKSYDPLYDQYRAFAGSMTSNNSRQTPNQPGQGRPGQSQSSQRQLLDHANRKNDPQAGAAGSKSGKGKRDQTTSQGRSTLSKEATAAREEHAERSREERSREERRLAERRREEAARAQRKLPLAQDQAKISMLRLVQTKLKEADHDYRGQRVEAMQALGQALHHLGSAAPPGVGAGSSLGSLSQAQSDGILRDAIFKLKGVEGQLSGSAGNYAHHAEARASVARAIHHLETALRIR
jgi:hypothetical protein